MSHLAYYLGLLVVVLGWIGVVSYRMFLRTKLLSFFTFSLAAWTCALVFLLSFLLRNYLPMLLGIVFIGGGIVFMLTAVSSGFMSTKEDEGHRYLRNKTTWIQRRFIGNVPQEDLRQLPPVKKRHKGVFEGVFYLAGSFFLVCCSIAYFFIKGRFILSCVIMAVCLALVGLTQVLFSFWYLSK